jgi:hypothetical protein
MIKYDFIISDYHLNQRPLRSIAFQWNADNADGYDKILFHYQRSSSKSASSAFYCISMER